MKIIRKENIFIIDSIGALLSALCLVFIICNQEWFGMPKTNLYLFATLGFLFSAHSITCHFSKLSNWDKNLKIIATLNILYCILTIFSILQNFKSLTNYGFIYFALELSIIAVLVVLELEVAKTK
jgi:hypothetical protein